LATTIGEGFKQLAQGLDLSQFQRLRFFAAQNHLTQSRKKLEAHREACETVEAEWHSEMPHPGQTGMGYNF
jgi:hypothetical protein